MREILFKAKRLDNGEWVCWNIYGDLCRLNGKRTRLAIKNGATTHYYDYIYQVIERIDKNTLCQYTGLTDKNGNKIWENDICDRYEKFYEIVKYHEGDFVLDYSYALGKEEGDSYCNLGFYVCKRNSVKAIGNIFDNPDLLQ